MVSTSNESVGMLEQAARTRLEVARYIGEHVNDMVDVGFTHGVRHRDHWGFDFSGGWRSVVGGLTRVGIHVTHVAFRRTAAGRDFFGQSRPSEVASYGFLRQQGDGTYIEICRWFPGINRALFLSVANGIETDILALGD